MRLAKTFRSDALKDIAEGRKSEWLWIIDDSTPGEIIFADHYRTDPYEFWACRYDYMGIPPWESSTVVACIRMEMWEKGEDEGHTIMWMEAR